MTITDRIRKKLKQRDPYCWHCGADMDLVIHHRRNRQMGGSKLLDHYTNLLMVCSEWNGLMESDSKSAQNAREWGHKLQSWQDFVEPVLDRCNGNWYQLNQDGTKTLIEGRDQTLI
jgi:5-methylcytosine-specific restriction endonuclease McrA